MKLCIAQGVIRGMNYLHTKTPPVIHGAFKIQNVLITEEYTKVANYELTVPLIRQMLLHVRYVRLTVWAVHVSSVCNVVAPYAEGLTFS